MMKVTKKVHDFNKTDNIEIVDVAEQCLHSESFLPLIKEEIKLKIQYKRVKLGKEELKIEPSKPVTYLLTEQEILKRNRRKEQNRRSAIRTRARQKVRIVELEKEVQALESNQQNLHKNVQSLTEELQTLENILNTHKCKNTSLPSTCRQVVSLPIFNEIIIEGM